MMSGSLKQRLVLHIGLHKTGSTSLQLACTQARSSLREAGIEYPDLPALTGGTVQHVLLAPLLRQADGFSRLIDVLRTLCSEDTTQCVLLSAEELATFFTRPDDRSLAKVVIDGLDRHFDDWQAYAVVREGPAMIRSLVRQTIESEGYPRSLSDTARRLREYQFTQCRRIKDLLGAKLTGIDYDELPRSAFCRTLLQRLTGQEVALSEVQANVTSAKPFKWLLSAGIRRFWADVSPAEHPYSISVTNAVVRTLDAIAIDSSEEERLVDALERNLDSVAELVMEQVPFEQRLIDLVNG